MLRRVWAAALVLVLAACGTEGAADSSITIPDEGETTSSTEPTTTTQPAPSTTATTSTTTPPSVVLGFDGLGVAAFRETETGVIDALEAFLGPPDDDSGWVQYADQQPGFGACGGDEWRLVRWGQLGVLLTNGAPPGGGDATPHFAMYGYGGLHGLAPSVPALTTADGVTVGTSGQTVLDVYGAAATFVAGDEIVSPYILIEDGSPNPMLVLLDGDAPTGDVIGIRAGFLCGE